jgi:methionyl aminopeptidase
LDDFKGRLTKDGIRIHNPEDFAGMHAAGRIAADILDRVAPMVVPGATTGEIDTAIEKMVEDAGATSATIGYKGYEHASCISVNHVVCHGIPGSKVLKEGDILNIDVTVIVDGWFGDTSRMFAAGRSPARPSGWCRSPMTRCSRGSRR